VPCVSLVALCGRSLREGDDLFGTFESPRKARNALQRIAADRRLCHSILGLDAGSCAACAGRPPDKAPDCGRPTGRLAQLTRAFSGLRGLRVPPWPYPGPIGVRERRDVHVFDRWQYLGTARTSSEIHDVLETRPPEFEVRVFRLLVKTLPRLSRQRIVPLPCRGGTTATNSPWTTGQREEAPLAPPVTERIAEMSSPSAPANCPAESSIGS
jgi:hypothetical protein